MANAVILAEPNAPFLRRWLNEYRSFRSQGKDRYWSEHSVQLPAQLAKAYPEEFTVLPPTAFYWPLWTEDHLKWIFRSDEPIFLDLAYANRLWESSAWEFVQHLTPGDVRAKSTNFHKWALPFLAGLPDDFGAPTMLERLDRIRASLGLGILSFAGVVAAAPFAAALYHAPVLRTLLPLMALAMPLTALSTVPMAQIRADLNFAFLQAIRPLNFCFCKSSRLHLHCLASESSASPFLSARGRPACAFVLGGGKAQAGASTDPPAQDDGR